MPVFVGIHAFFETRASNWSNWRRRYMVPDISTRTWRAFRDTLSAQQPDRAAPGLLVSGAGIRRGSKPPCPT